MSQFTAPSNNTVSNAIALLVFQTACYFSAAIEVVIPSCDTRNDWNSCELIVMFNFFFFFLLLEVVFHWWRIVVKLKHVLCKCELCNQYTCKVYVHDFVLAFATIFTRKNISWELFSVILMLLCSLRYSDLHF